MFPRAEAASLLPPRCRRPAAAPPAPPAVVLREALGVVQGRGAAHIVLQDRVQLLLRVGSRRERLGEPLPARGMRVMWAARQHPLTLKAGSALASL